MMEECNAEAAMCRCDKSKGHVEEGDTVHECEDKVNCNGAWKGDFHPDNPDFEIVRFPGFN